MNFSDFSSKFGGLIWPALLLFLFVAYSPSLNGDFLWDDDHYITQNRHLASVEGLKNIWLSPGATPQYYPLVFTSFFIEHKIWGFNTLGYHSVNVLLHFFNAFLLFLLLRNLSFPGAFLAAVIFLFHPVHVETVAWISERKNTLSGLFALLSLLFYFKSPYGSRRIGKRGFSAEDYHYWAAFVFFIAALLSKTVTATIPVVILIIQWIRGGDFSRDTLFRVLPFFLVGGIFVSGTIIMERVIVGVRDLDFGLTLVDRVVIASRAVFFYAGKIIWPYPLMFNYPRWAGFGLSFTWLLWPAALALGLGILAKKSLTWGRGPLGAVLIFIVSLAPALGFIDFFPMKFSFVADHFQYLPSIALIALGGAGIRLLFERINNQRLSAAVSAVLVLALAWGTWTHAHAFTSPNALWLDTVRKNPSSLIANANLGATRVQEGRYIQALPYLERALEAEPDNFYTKTSLAVAYIYLSRSDKALNLLREVLEKEERYFQARGFLGQALLLSGKPKEAIEELNSAIQNIPSYPLLRIWRAQAWMALGNFSYAEKELKSTMARWPQDSAGQTAVGAFFILTDRLKEAQVALSAAAALKPMDRFVVWDLANGFLMLGMRSQAGRVYEDLAERRPDLEFVQADREKIKKKAPSFSFQGR